MRLKNLFLIMILMFCASTEVLAQNLSVVTYKLLENNNTARRFPQVAGDNRDTCAVIILRTPGIKGLEFPNHNQYYRAIATDTCAALRRRFPKPGTYLVYVPAVIGNMISYRHESYLPGTFSIRDYGMRRMKKAATYEVVMKAEAASTDAVKSKVVLKIHPVSARLTFDGATIETVANGIYEFEKPAGSYSYEVSLANYRVRRGTVQLGQSDAKTVNLILQPIMHRVTVSCNIDDATVYVDDDHFGKVGQLMLPQGNHRVRVQAANYIDSEQTVDIKAGAVLDFNLKKNRNLDEIHAVLVTINSSASTVYKNNKRLEGWAKEKPMKFMPGKYYISDDKDNEMFIKVERDRPMTVDLDTKEVRY